MKLTYLRNTESMSKNAMPVKIRKYFIVDEMIQNTNGLFYCKLHYASKSGLICMFQKALLTKYSIVIILKVVASDCYKKFHENTYM